MKKLLTIVMTLVMLIGCVSLTALAEEDPLSADVYVTISDKDGKLALAYEKITVTDNNSDGVLTIDEALYAAHEAKFDGGAEAGYASSVGNWGLSLDKLWGTANGGSYGYCVNNASAMGLGDEIKAGDHISAYVYTDLSSYSDTYCYFDVNTLSAQTGEEITLTLKASGYDANWNPVTLSVEGAAITLNGEKTNYTTDTNGNVTLKIEKGGNYVISATSKDQTLVPPVCIANIMADENAGTYNKTDTNDNETDANDTNANDTDKDDISTSPKTGDNTLALLMVISFVTLGAGVVVISAVKKGYYEK